MSDRDDRKGAERRRVSPALIVGIVLALAAVDFVVQNNNDVPVHFLFFESERPVWMVILVTCVLAVVAAELISDINTAPSTTAIDNVIPRFMSSPSLCQSNKYALCGLRPERLVQPVRPERVCS